MLSQSFDFDEFISKVSDKGLPEIIAAAEHEADAAEAMLRGRTKRAVDAKARGGRSYVEELGQFLFFMRHGNKPFGVTEHNFDLYRVVCNKLVEKGQYKPTILDVFS